MENWQDVVRKIGHAAAVASSFVADQVVAGYQAVDPDVGRHLIQVPLLGYTLLVSRVEEIEPGVPDGHPPLIYVHGLGGNRGNFLLMSWFLHMLGRKRSYKIHFDSGQSLDEMAEALAQFIRSVVEVTGEPQVDLVCHSLGGIVGRLAMVDHDCTDLVKTYISLGSPHGGTYAARYANTDILRELRPDSKLIRRLGEHAWPANVRGISFFSHNDVFVIPGEAAALKGCEQVDVSPFTHYSYLIDPECWKRVGRMLMHGQVGRMAVLGVE